MSTTDKKEKVENLRRYHQNLLDSIGASDALYVPRMAYKPTSHHEIVISFFASELKQGKDIYTEFVSKEFEPEDPDRTLWKWRYNPFWKEEYERSKDVVPSAIKYYVPVSELVLVSRNNKKNFTKDKIPHQTESLTSMLKKPETPKEEMVTDMTIRDFAAILWREPVSNKKWLNDLINSVS